jgi:plasmid stabilization system protein ParE
MNVGRRAAIWSAPVIADLHGIWDHYAALTGHATADRLIREIERVVGIIEMQPIRRQSERRAASRRSIDCRDTARHFLSRG